MDKNSFWTDGVLHNIDDINLGLLLRNFVITLVLTLIVMYSDIAIDFKVDVEFS
jgi:hypothetical protein